MEHATNTAPLLLSSLEVNELMKLVPEGPAREFLLKEMAVQQRDRLDHEQTIETACSHYCDDELEIDDVPVVAPGEKGCWVMAWVYVAIEDSEADNDDEDSEAED